MAPFPHNKPYSLLLPGASPELSQHPLIDKNHKEHDIFFSRNGKHNHLIHHYLTAYALGASMEKLKSIYDGHATMLIPIISDEQEITEETYRKEIGNRDAYGSYLKFFKKEVAERGILDAIRYWIFKDDMLARTLGGVYYPLIHLGYAVEFDLPSVAAEGLAMAACTEDILVSVMDLSEESIQEKRYNGTSSIQELIKGIRDDSTFDGGFDIEIIDRLPLIMENAKMASKLREYAADWKFKDLHSSLRELFTSCVLIYGASGIREQGIKLSFFLVHALTSIHALYTIMPYLNPVQAELLLRGHLVETLACYISQGRPTLRVDLVTQYQSPHQSKDKGNPWTDIVNRALAVNECHSIKAVRALALGQVIYRDSLEDIWIKVAQITLDVIGPARVSYMTANWDYKGVGFDEAWQE